MSSCTMWFVPRMTSHDGNRIVNTTVSKLAFSTWSGDWFAVELDDTNFATFSRGSVAKDGVINRQANGVRNFYGIYEVIDLMHKIPHHADDSERIVDLIEWFLCVTNRLSRVSSVSARKDMAYFLQPVDRGLNSREIALAKRYNEVVNCIPLFPEFPFVVQMRENYKGFVKRKFYVASDMMQDNFVIANEYGNDVYVPENLVQM